MENPAVELWELAGSHWKLPIHVQKTGDLAVVRRTETRLLPKQAAALEEAMSRMAIGGQSGEWHVPMQTLVMVAEESRYSDPDDVVVWQSRPPACNHFPKEDGADDFIASWASSSGMFQSTATAAAVYASLMAHMLHWLLNEGKPVKLLFATIYPLLVRRNWKEIVWGKMLLTQDIRQEWYSRRLVPTDEELTSADLTVWYEATKSAGWNLEIIPERWFEKQAKDVEIQRSKKYQRFYGNHLVRQMRRQIDIAREAFASFASAIHEKSLTLPHVYFTSRKALNKSRYYSEGKVIRPIRTFVCPAVIVKPETPDSVPDDVSKAFGIVPEMSRVQPPPVVLREFAKDVDEPGDKPDGTDGMPVLSSDKGAI